MRPFFIFFLFFFSLSIQAQKFFLFVGTYTGSGSKGIYVYQFDASTGKASWITNTDGKVVNPSYLDIAPGDSLLYACTETKDGGLGAFKFDRSTGKLALINQQKTGGDDPAYVAVHPKGKWATTGNYSGGSLTAFAINKDGSLQPYGQLIKHTGKSINKERQEMAHVHATVFSPKGDYLFTPDLGMDKVMIYRFDASLQKPLQPALQQYVSTTPGSGPRHLIFHQNGRWAYLIEEMGGAVVAYNYNNGKLAKFQEIVTHPDSAKGDFRSADIHISPDGKFLYTSNRAPENNIAIFSINSVTGKLSLAGYQSTGGKTPRNFCIDPGGNYLLAANQDSDNITIFLRDKKTGLLTATGEQIIVPKPVCLKMIK